MANNNKRRPWGHYESTIPSPPRQDKYSNKDREAPCIKTARTKTELLDCLDKMQQERPEDPAVRAMIYNEVKEVVDRDPYLEYHAENTHSYRVIDRAQQVLIVPKERAVPEPYPVKRPEPFRMANRFLVLVILGFALSGLGAIVFAPFAFRYAIRALGESRSPADQVRAAVVAILAMLFFGAGLALVFLLWLHIRG
jgi:hypothetical protein